MGRVLSLMLGLVCLLGALYTAHRALEFHRHGEVVLGTVVEDSQALGVMAGGVSRSQPIRVRYTPLGSDTPLELQTGLTSSWFTSPEPGETFAVRYLPERPADARQDSLLIDLVAPLGLLVLGLSALSGPLGPSAHGSRRLKLRS